MNKKNTTPLRGFIFGIFLFFATLFLTPSCGGGTTDMTTTPDELTEDLGTGAPNPEDGFDLDTTLELGRLCLQAYQMLIDFNNNKTFTLPAPFTLVKTFSTNESFTGVASAGGSVPISFVATKDENIYVVFRGTVTIIEWIDDAEFTQKPYNFLPNGGLTETGFTDVYATLNTDIIQTVNQLAQNGDFTTLYVTGHSLGAALAVEAAPDLAVNTSFSGLTMVNFAGPRVGNPHFANVIYANNVMTSFRVANTHDIVPTLPPPVIVLFENGQKKFLFYEHVNKGKTITFGNPITGPTDFKDIEANHIMCNYYNALCEMSSEIKTCKEMADGADGCNAKTN